MTQRRYSEDEVAAIFRTATETPEALRSPATSGGLTLPQLQEIGREVGLSEEAVARAAARLDQSPIVGRPQPAGITGRYFGMPIRVGTTVELKRRLSDVGWEQLVNDMRTTFDAHGRMEMEGSRRVWSGAGVSAELEPTDTGERFTIHMSKRSAPAWMWSAIVALNGAAVTFFFPLAGLSDDVNFLRGSVGLLAAGLAMFAYSARKLPGWARLHKQQVDGVITRLLAATAEPTR